MKRRWLALLFVAGSVLAATPALWFQGGTANAAFSGQDIASAGPLTHIYVGDQLSCQVAHTGDTDYEMFDPSDQQGACGTVVFFGGESYGNYANTELTPVSQTPVTGSGTSGDPFQVITVADAGNTGVRITETVKYVVGDEFYRTDTVVQNNGNTQLAVKIYTYADCYLGGSDSGYGYLDPIGGVVACTENADNSPPGRIEEWTPITPPDHFYEAHYNLPEQAAFNGTDLPDTCVCSTNTDNGAALQWNRTLNAGGGSSTVSHFKTFSPLGVGAPTPTPGGPSTSVTATPGRRIRTHTPTATPSAENTSTPAPATNTPPAVPTLAPTQPGGAAAGSIHAPDTGSGDGAESSRNIAWLVSAFAMAVGGIGALTIGRRVRARR